MGFQLSYWGNWFLRSKKDPRWNAEGIGFVHNRRSKDCERTIKDLKEKYGQEPDDLIWGFARC